MADTMTLWPIFRRTRRVLVMGSLLATVAIAAPAIADAGPDHTAETAAIAKDFMHIQYDMHDLKGAKAKYYAPDFTQHNPEIGNGVKGDQVFIAARQQREPEKFLPPEQWNNVVDHVLVQDKYFAVHHHLYTNPNDKGRVFMDIWRVENGKMVEHWDIIQPVNEAPQNGNTMWSSVIPAQKPGAHDPAPETVINDYLRVGLEQNDARKAAELYIDDHFVQHSAHIPDGKAALIAYFAKRQQDAKPDEPKRTNSVSHIIADGDLVLVTRHVLVDDGSKGMMYADLFRVQHGKIVEHWDVLQKIPDTSANGNNMW